MKIYIFIYSLISSLDMFLCKQRQTVDHKRHKAEYICRDREIVIVNVCFCLLLCSDTYTLTHTRLFVNV